MLSAVPVDIGHDDRLAALLAAVRPEFAGDIIRVDPDDPVFGRGRCGVAGCARTSWALQLCAAHHQRWAKHGKPAVEQFRATTGPIAERAGSEMVDAFDLSTLAVRPRLEVAYTLQHRHDDRSVRVPPSTIRHLVGLLVDSGANSLLERPLDSWLDAVRARGGKDPTRTIALLRYAPTWAWARLVPIRGAERAESVEQTSPFNPEQRTELLGRGGGDGDCHSLAATRRRCGVLHGTRPHILRSVPSSGYPYICMTYPLE